MSKYTNRVSLMDMVLEGVAALAVVMLLLLVCWWVFIQIWLFLLGGLLLAGGIYALVCWRRWRQSGW